MVTAIEAIKRQYENTTIVEHDETMVFNASHRGVTVGGADPEVISTQVAHMGWSTFEVRSEKVAPKVPGMGFWITRDHPEVEGYRLSSEGNLCSFCSTLPESKLEDRFTELVADWRRGTGGLSSPRAIVSHPAYQQIIEMGNSAIPMIFQELQENGGWWYPALRALTGVNPIPEAAKGKPPLNREAWLEWGRRNGYL